MTWRGELLHIHMCHAGSEPMTALDRTELVPGVGIPEDRYATGKGHYSHKPHLNRQVTLFEVETLEALARDHAIALGPHEHRRNLTTQSVPLNHLVDSYFQIGDECVLYGGRLNVPCKYLEDLVGKKVFRLLMYRSGLNCRVVRGGVVRPGDQIHPFDPVGLDAAVRADNEAIPREKLPDT